MLISERFSSVEVFISTEVENIVGLVVPIQLLRYEDEELIRIQWLHGCTKLPAVSAPGIGRSVVIEHGTPLPSILQNCKNH